MKRLLLIISLLASCSVFGQEESKCTTTLLNSFLSVDQTTDYSAASFDVFLKKLEKKQDVLKPGSDFIQYLFAKTHQTFLKKYEAYASMSDVFKTGSYNCLTGTIIYALLLDHFQIPHQVIETNYHIFILAETKGGAILLEATDPLNGLVTKAQEIESRMRTYKSNRTIPSSSKMHYYQFNTEMFNPVSMKELRGLLFYNKAINAYNQQNLEQSIQYLKEAHTQYASSKIDEFLQILLLTLQESNLENQLRTEYIKTVLSMKRSFTPAMALLH